jgi:hypothetical protein
MESTEFISFTDVGEDRLHKGDTSIPPDTLHEPFKSVVMVEGGWGAGESGCSVIGATDRLEEDRLGDTSTTPDKLHEPEKSDVMVEGGWEAGCAMVVWMLLIEWKKEVNRSTGVMMAVVSIANANVCFSGERQSGIPLDTKTKIQLFGGFF